MKTATSAPALEELIAALADCLTLDSARRVIALKADPKLQERVDGKEKQPEKAAKA